MKVLEEKYAQASGNPEAFAALVQQCEQGLREFQRTQGTLEGWEQSLNWVLALFHTIDNLSLLEGEDKHSLLHKHIRAMLCAVYRTSTREAGS